MLEVPLRRGLLFSAAFSCPSFSPVPVCFVLLCPLFVFAPVCLARVFVTCYFRWAVRRLLSLTILFGNHFFSHQINLLPNYSIDRSNA